MGVDFSFIILSLWCEDGVHFGAGNRTLNTRKINAGFYYSFKP